MLQFDPAFFEDEERCGFVVDKTMKACWAAQMEMLYDVNEICEKHDIPYFIMFGSLIGTIRHQGYIPWDDDIDIGVLREDYDRLMPILAKELAPNYQVHYGDTDEEASDYWSYILNSDSISIEPGHLEKFHGCPFMVGMDVFPIDFIPESEKEREELHEKMRLLWTTCRLVKHENKTKQEEESLVKLLAEIEKRYRMKFDHSKPLPHQIIKLQNELMRGVKETDNCYLSVPHNFMDWPDRLIPKECFGTIEWKPFENIFVPVPVGYDTVLTKWYGDYMTMRPFTASHDYPFYKRQLEFLREKVEKQSEGNI